mmetsp:Transcript_35769/g.90183  ORF Transcript_35769/g.90183 Transcript_35769/m.90183 type:complete len:332 (-) Transcript_35769:494-1489(-)
MARNDTVKPSAELAERLRLLDAAREKNYSIVQVASAKELSPGEIIQKAANKALGGGIAGAAAMAVQVTTLMWMRTTMNYQYRYGTTTRQALAHLYKEGGGGLNGVLRFYKGYLPALAQGPLSRFGDTAANAGVLALLDGFETTKNLPTFLKSMCASGGAASFRILIMPIDALKTTLQVEGNNAMPILKSRLASGGPKILWNGSLAAAGATFVGHFPWFFTYNTLNENLPPPDKFATFMGNETAQKLSRNAMMGFIASAVSDTSSNSIRVIKTTKQTHQENISYVRALREILEKDGYVGLFGRGLKTRLMTNGLQGIMFSVMWRLFQDQMKV